MNIDIEQFNQLIRNRRSVKPKKFKPGSKVPDHVVKQALLNATWAPNHGNTEPWEFRVYSAEGLIKHNEFQSELYKKESGEKFTQAKYESLKTMHHTVSHTIAICYKKNAASKIPALEEIEAVACAVQNLALTIAAYGYAGLWSSGSITYYPAAKPYFNLEENDQLLGFFLVGEPTEESPTPPRKPIAEKVVWINS
jgi:nitroreductase